jgi:hypothetical protein
LTDTLHGLVLRQYDRLIGLELAALSAPQGALVMHPSADKAGRSPVDRDLFLSAAFVTLRALIREARQRFRWAG